MSIENDYSIFVNLYKDAITRTEPALVEYISQRYPVIAQPEETKSAKMCYFQNKKYVLPDMEIGSNPRPIFVESKAYNESVTLEYYKNSGDQGLSLKEKLKTLIGYERFNFAQKNHADQGLDKKDFDNYTKIQNMFKRPIIIAFNDHDLKTYDNNQGLWYGAFLEYFNPKNKNVETKYKNRNNVNKKKDLQYYLRIKDMRPVFDLIKIAQQKNYHWNKGKIQADLNIFL